MSEFDFFPDKKRAIQIDHKMRQSLADSLDYIASQIKCHINFDEPAFQAIIRHMRSGERFPPSSFALFTDLVAAIESGRLSDASLLLELLNREQAVNTSWNLLSLSDSSIDSHAERYTRLMDSDPLASFKMLPPAEKDVSLFESSFHQANKLIAQCAPALKGEMEQLVTQIILVSDNPESEYQFDGGSSYMLWGGLFLNASTHRHPVTMAEVLAHECAHILLFGFASDEALVENSGDELFSSPLRVDQRPMDGIYHATYVSARMHWIMAELLKSGLLDQEGSKIARNSKEINAQNFYSGYDIVEKHGQLSQTGFSVMESAKHYMDLA